MSGISDHAESYRAGYGSNHSDMGQWLPNHGKSMDALRAEVQEILNNEEDDEVSYDQWKEYMTQYRKELQDNDCGDWSKEAREWAVNVGLFAGSGTGPDGQPNMMWQDQLSREQAAQLFYRFAQKAGLV